MTFEDAIASFAEDIGQDLDIEDGVAKFAATAEDGVQVEVTVSAMDDGESALLCADLGEMPSEGGNELMLSMLEANHLFASTGGATLSVDGGRVKLERYVGLAELQRGEGAGIFASFARAAQEWRGVVAGEDGRVADDGVVDGDVRI